MGQLVHLKPAAQAQSMDCSNDAG